MNVLIVSRRKTLSLVAAFGFAAMAIFAGWRYGGLDRGNYTAIYSFITSNGNLASKLLVVKDIAFLAISLLANYWSDDARLAFLITCLLSFGTKYYAIKHISSKYLLSFLIVYSVLLSPGLEFAAMRSALAIGFLMLAISYSSRFILFALLSVLSVAAHISLLPAVILAYHPFNEFVRKHRSSYAIITAMVFLISGKLLEWIPRGEDYAENRGTLLAFAAPIATSIVAYLVFFNVGKVERKEHDHRIAHLLNTSQPLIYALIAISFGVSSTIVTASTRYLEIVWCLLLLPAIVMCRRSWMNMTGLIVLIALLSYFNIVRHTWMAVARPDFF